MGLSIKLATVQFLQDNLMLSLRLHASTGLKSAEVQKVLLQLLVPSFPWAGSGRTVYHKQNRCWHIKNEKPHQRLFVVLLSSLWWKASSLEPAFHLHLWASFYQERE